MSMSRKVTTRYKHLHTVPHAEYVNRSLVTATDSERNDEVQAPRLMLINSVIKCEHDSEIN